MTASHVAVDTRDGYIFWQDSEGLFDQERAQAFADERNAGMRVPYNTSYQVYALVPVGETEGASGDDLIVQAAVQQWQQGHPISDGQARVLASRWHSGQTSPLYTLTSTGAIPLADTRSELQAEIARLADVPEREEVECLLAYVEQRGLRGAVFGWTRLWG